MEKLLIEIRELISDNQMDEAFEQTLILAKTASIGLHQNTLELKRQFKDWKQRNRNSREAKNEELNKIVHSLLEVLNDVEKNFKKQNIKIHSNDDSTKQEHFQVKESEETAGQNKVFLMFTTLFIGCLIGLFVGKFWLPKEEKLPLLTETYDWNYDVRNVGVLFFDDNTLDDLKNYLKKTPINGTGDSKYYYIRGRIYHQLGDWKEAASEYQKSINLDSTQTEASLMLGRVLSKINEDDALKVFTILITKNSTSIPIQYNYAVCLMKKFESTRNQDFLHLAKEIFNNITTKDKNCEILGAYHNYGQICIQLGDYEEGIKYLNKVIDKSPLFAKAHFYKGIGLYKLNKKEDALKFILASFEFNKSLILSHKETYSELISDKNIGYQLTEYLKFASKVGQ